MQPNNPQRPNPAGQRPQFFDVVRPGRTPASPNSRPVLPGNRPAVQDTSMMKSGAPAVPPGLMQQAAPRPMAPAPVQPTQPTQMPVQAPAAPAPVSLQQRFSPSPEQPVQPTVESTPAAKEPAQPAAPKQKHSIWSEVFAVLAIVLLIVIILDILVDADILNLPIPHTNFFDY